ncbi:tRNA epoxyqueuosine(34) reductase QueG [Crateriforma spongiae]|uniref:tRNA epoxyqueuosine(34) reductase QueG n=1 Tax=Crateriforma spongiae TaxID=2724528 RepID=UPI0014482DCB|nr:tRNA epoxyqueuosine(34) reductase QueG [Crateriforma spongiae]
MQSDPVPDDLKAEIRAVAGQLGFHLCGFAPAVSSQGHSDLLRWIDEGYAAEMDYFSQRIDAYKHPSGVLPGVRSIIALAYPYPSASERIDARGKHIPSDGQTPSGRGKVARYVWTGDDYHDWIHPKLKTLCRTLQSCAPESRSRGVVDTAPLMEREVAQLAGLGWRGKNTLLLRPLVGSYFFLACVLTTVELQPDPPFDRFHCGTCTACLDACPTDAFPQPGVMDASRCISYLTIEHRGSIPRPLRPQIGDWVFGCDVCQEVCPWNRQSSRENTRPNNESVSPSEPTMTDLDLHDLFTLDDEQFRKRYRKTALWRTRRRGILRNAAIVLGNQGTTESLGPLTTGLSDHEPLVRSASAWALGRIGGKARSVLMQRLATEDDPEVIAEIQSAIDHLA